MYWKSAHRNFCKKSCVGFCVARFDWMGNAKASRRETGNSTDSHAFFVVIVNLTLQTATIPIILLTA